jgi:hypothetical protein
MDKKNRQALKSFRRKLTRGEREFYQSISQSMLLLDQEEYGFVRADVQVTGSFFSNVALNRLHHQLGIEVELLPDKKVIERDALILGVKPESYVGRRNVVPELDRLEIEGNVYMGQRHMYCLVFPIDLVRQNHIRIHKWKFVRRHNERRSKT